MTCVTKLSAMLQMELKTHNFDFDIAINGIQVNATKDRKIERIVTAVDATIDVINEAIRLEADCLIVHHGICWGSYLPEPWDIKRKLLEDADCNLLAYHLPLDSHPVIGNNAQLAKLFNLIMVQPFGKLPNDQFIGLKGSISEEHFDDYKNAWLSGRIHHALSNNDIKLEKDTAVPVAIVSGAGGDFFKEAQKEGIRLFITGECRYQDALAIKDGMKMKVDFIGHHASETLGIQALGEMVASKLALKHSFIDQPIYY